ncbi:MAG: 5-formyltetrahydrofolate cyclo-ligase, partial [Acidimicrobiia bacterium]
MPSTLPAPPDPESPKAAWRSWAAGIDRSVWSAQVADRLLAWPPLHGVVARYLAMPDEVDLASLDHVTRMRMLVPRTEAGDMLTLHDLNPGALVQHPFGFLEPDSASKPVDVNDVDVVLVPGTVFDRSGIRIGRGAGMYDR